MTEIVNLRTVRKRAARKKAELGAAANRLAHGTSRADRNRTAAERERIELIVDRHRIKTEDCR